MVIRVAFRLIRARLPGFGRFRTDGDWAWAITAGGSIGEDPPAAIDSLSASSIGGVGRHTSIATAKKETPFNFHPLSKTEAIFLIPVFVCVSYPVTTISGTGC